MYKTADEVVQEGASKRYRGDISALSSVKVIDMTGPEQRILSGENANLWMINSEQYHCVHRFTGLKNICIIQLLWCFWAVIGKKTKNIEDIFIDPIIWKKYLSAVEFFWITDEKVTGLPHYLQNQENQEKWGNFVELTDWQSPIERTSTNVGIRMWIIRA